MTIQEIKEKANNDIKRARDGYRDNIISFLDENNLRGEVIRVKDGTEGKKPVSVWEDNILKDFKSHTNQGEIE